MSSVDVGGWMSESQLCHPTLRHSTYSDAVKYGQVAVVTGGATYTAPGSSAGTVHVEVRKPVERITTHAVAKPSHVSPSLVEQGAAGAGGVVPAQQRPCPRQWFSPMSATFVPGDAATRLRDVCNAAAGGNVSGVAELTHFIRAGHTHLVGAAARYVAGCDADFGGDVITLVCNDAPDALLGCLAAVRNGQRPSIVREPFGAQDGFDAAIGTPIAPLLVASVFPAQVGAVGVVVFAPRIPVAGVGPGAGADVGEKRTRDAGDAAAGDTGAGPGGPDPKRPRLEGTDDGVAGGDDGGHAPAPDEVAPPPCPDAVFHYLASASLLTEVAVGFVSSRCVMYAWTDALVALRRNMVVISPYALLRLSQTAPGRCDPAHISRFMALLANVHRHVTTDSNLPSKLATAVAEAGTRDNSVFLALPLNSAGKPRAVVPVKLLTLAREGQKAAFSYPKRQDVLPAMDSPSSVAGTALLLDIMSAGASGRQVALFETAEALRTLPDTSPAGLLAVRLLRITQVQLDRAGSLSPDAEVLRRGAASQHGVVTSVDGGIATIAYVATHQHGQQANQVRPAHGRHMPQHVTASTSNGRWRRDTRRSGVAQATVAALAQGGRGALSTAAAVRIMQRPRFTSKLCRQGRLRALDTVALARGLRAEVVARDKRAHAAVGNVLAAAFANSAPAARIAAKLHLNMLRSTHGRELRSVVAWARTQAIRDRAAAYVDLLKRAARGGDRGRGTNRISRCPTIALGDGLQLGAAKGTRGGRRRVQASLRRLAEVAVAQLRWCLVGVAECWTSQCHPACGGHARNPTARYHREVRREDGTTALEVRTGKCSRALLCTSCHASGNRDGWAADNIGGVVDALLVAMPAYHALRHGPLWAPRHTASWDKLAAERRA